MIEWHCKSFHSGTQKMWNPLWFQIMKKDPWYYVTNEGNSVGLLIWQDREENPCFCSEQQTSWSDEGLEFVPKQQKTSLDWCRCVTLYTLLHCCCRCWWGDACSQSFRRKARRRGERKAERKTLDCFHICGRRKLYFILCCLFATSLPSG